MAPNEQQATLKHSLPAHRNSRSYVLTAMTGRLTALLVVVPATGAGASLLLLPALLIAEAMWFTVHELKHEALTQE